MAGRSATRVVLTFSVVALANCGTAQIAPSPSRLEASVARSWMDPAVGSQDLLYLSDVQSNAVAVYTYPAGKRVGTLSSFQRPRSECSDRNGNVWIADTGGYDIVEYAHGATQPIAALSTPNEPRGCSVDPVTGNLAVTGAADRGGVFVYHYSEHGQWRDPRQYAGSAIRTAYFCGYDANGDLFVDGLDKAGGFRFAELPRHGYALVDVSVNQSIKVPGQVQWDGKNIAVGDADGTPSKIYRFSVAGTHASKVGTTTLGGSISVRQFWTSGNTVVGPDFDRFVAFWHYPGGGSLAKKIAIPGYGATISVAPRGRSERP